MERSLTPYCWECKFRGFSVYTPAFCEECSNKSGAFYRLHSVGDSLVDAPEAMSLVWKFISSTPRRSLVGWDYTKTGNIRVRYYDPNPELLKWEEKRKTIKV